MPDPRNLKAQAAAALDKGKYKKALEAYLALEELEPGDGQWPRRAADMFRRLGQHKPAIAALERAADRYMRAGFLVKAIAVCKMILQLEPTHSTVQQRLAALNANRGMATAEGSAVPPGTPVSHPAAPPPIPAARPPGTPPPVPGKPEVPPPMPPGRTRQGVLPNRFPRARTIPHDAPLEEISLGDLVPGATAELDRDGHDSGIIEIPLELASQIDGMLGPPGEMLSPQDERILRETPLLSSLGPEAMRRLIAEVSLVELGPGQVLFREGEPGRTLYVIAEGAVSVISEKPPRVHLSQLKEGDFFGEIALVTNQLRSATIEADAERGAHLLAIDRNVIGDLVEEEPEVLQALLRFLRDRLVDRLIHTSPLFAAYTGGMSGAGSEGRSLAARFRFLEVQPGAEIMSQGQRAAGLCVCLSVQFEAVHTAGDVVRRLGTPGPGSMCGEMSLLSGEPALFTVRATSKGFVLQLPAGVFHEVIMTHPQVLVFVAELADERRRRYEAIVAGDADYDTGRVPFV